MKYDKDYRNTYTLSTGKEVYANRGIIGIDPSLESISEGYDGSIGSIEGYSWREDPLTIDEMDEIAQYAIQLWTGFRQKLKERSKT